MKRGKAGGGGREDGARESVEPEDDMGARIDFSLLKPGVTKRFPSFLERYTVQKFRAVPPPPPLTPAETAPAETAPATSEAATTTTPEVPCEDQWVCQHSNKLVVVGVAQTHAIFTRTDPATGRAHRVVGIDWTSNSGADRQELRVTGKGGRKGGVGVGPESLLCAVTMDDGTVYRLRAAVKGTLVEVNPRLVGAAGCALLMARPATEGYLALVRPKHAEAATCTAGLLTREQFCALRHVPLETTFLNPAPSSH